jgi:hypothetical protein
MTDIAARQQFYGAVEAEVIRRVEEGSYHMTRDEVEEIAARVGLARAEGALRFPGLRGQVWEGQLDRTDEPPGWTEVRFDPAWFQKTGKMPRRPGSSR